MRKIIIALIASTGVALRAVPTFWAPIPTIVPTSIRRKKSSALLVSAYPSSTFYSVVDARCDGFVDYGTRHRRAYNSLRSTTISEDAFRWRRIHSLAGESAHGTATNPTGSAAYEAVAAANHALEAIERTGKNARPDHATRTFAAAKRCCARAYAHFCLLSLYSRLLRSWTTWPANPGIPYATDPEKTTVMPKYYDRETVAVDALEHVLQDLEDGMKIVGSASDYNEPKFHFTPHVGRWRFGNPRGALHARLSAT